jgi:predicted GH43/DUF377 family glycosyl hydrolase
MELYIFFLIALQVFLLVCFRNLMNSVRKAQSKSLSIILKNEKLLHNLNFSIQNFGKEGFIPISMMNIPLADEAGIITSVKKVSISSISAAHNPSIVKFGDGYLLFFRHDEPNFKNGYWQVFSNIGCISLDRNFEPLEKSYSKIETHSLFSEDARFFQNGDRFFLVYNDLLPRFKDRRGICIGEIDLHRRRLEYVTRLDLGANTTEKNWTPFSHSGEVHFLYTINPQKILCLPNPRKCLLRLLPDSSQLNLDWSIRWGVLRGGTPAHLMGEEYLAFFHSFFEDCSGIVWYIMGAYMFASSSPFKITRISPHPILFKGIYDSPYASIANPRIRSIYPIGFTCENFEGKELIHLSCGENDSAMKIISIDKNALLSSLKPIDSVSDRYVGV